MPLEVDAVNRLNVNMIVFPAVIVHGLPDARAALAPGLPVTLLSAPAAALFAGCQWWQQMIATARAENPETVGTDVLDCADASGIAMSALRTGVCRLILWPRAPGWRGIAEIANRHGGFVVTEPPPALDLAQPNAIRRLPAWLQGPVR